MKKLLLAMMALLALNGCISYTEIARGNSATLKVDGNEKPLAGFYTVNVSYKLFGSIPLTTGVPWQEGSYADRFKQPLMRWFKDECSIDNNLKALRCALDETQSDRISNLICTVNDDYMWSLFLIQRRVVRTSCLILEPQPKAGQTGTTVIN